MAIGAGSALVGVSLFYESLSFFPFAALFMQALHAFVVLYEEPTLRRTFGTEYASYCATVNRWLLAAPLRESSKMNSLPLAGAFETGGRGQAEVQPRYSAGSCARIA